MIQPALDTLFYGLAQAGGLPIGQRAVFVNAQYHKDMAGDYTCVQWFKPYADTLHEYECLSLVEDLTGFYDAAFLLWPKNMVEGRYLLAKTLSHLKDGGVFYLSAENNAGGNRLQKIVQQFGCEIVQQISKNKSRVIAAKKSSVDENVFEAALAEGSAVMLEKSGFYTQAGVYGWDKIDTGSEILLQYLPDDLSGEIADFGCGYGYLLQQKVQQNDLIVRAHAIDADARALVCARENMRDDARVDYLWADLSTRGAGVSNLDAVLMNPPFHEGKKTDSDIGAAFIRNAAESLKRRGVLYMVANTHLPYEAVLSGAFEHVECLMQQHGFKVFKACR